MALRWTSIRVSVTEDVGTYDWKQEIEAASVQVVNTVQLRPTLHAM